ncbi:MAG: hypothetical protein FJ128_00295 [Deltaproteobacteria bacterium]|nr:hypothetical protein [Deltaproteobacteria bacterium]
MPDYLVAIPTYWTHPAGRGEEAVIYGHPTPLDGRGTLRRTLLSLAPLMAPGTSVAVVVAAAHPSLAEAVEARVRQVLADPPLPYPVLLCGHSHLRSLAAFLEAHGRGGHVPLLSLEGYGAVRNVTLITATLCQAAALVSLDDDEVVDDPDFFVKIAADLEALVASHPVFGLAGIYQDGAGEVLLPEPQAPCARFWPKFRWMNEALRRLILTGPNLQPTPLAFGGNMILPAALFRQIPFDPALPRGEDVDYVMNSRFFGIPFFLDRTLAITHLPPVGTHPVWRRLRQDLVRFAYVRQKLRRQTPRPGLARVEAADLMPYPGNFLTDDLDLLAYRAHTLLARQYLEDGDARAARRTLENLEFLEEVNRDEGDAFAAYLDLQRHWEALMTWLARPEVAAAARRAVWGAA